MPDRTPEKNVDYVLGRIEGQLDNILKTLSENRMADATYRTEVRKQLGEGSERMQHIESQLALVTSDMGEIKPKVAVLEERMHMSNGAARLAVVLGKVGHIISAAIGGAIVIILDKLVFHR